MNANELADAMEIRASIRRQATSRKSVQEGANDRLADQLEQAATMLRQQQADYYALLVNHDKLYAKVVELRAEIEALKDEISTLRYEKSSGVYDDEPVAWIAYDEFGDFMLEATPEGDYPWQPLYTHPSKDLTDEEIYQILWKHFPISDKEKNATMIAVMTHCIRVALRKAQEK